MSQWTHVNGSIRVDSIQFLDNLNLEKELGKIQTYDDILNDSKTKIKLPKGSEGSLKYTIWKCSDESSLAAYTVNIFGDLRDYDDEKEIVKFLNKFVKNKMIRSGIVEIDIEGLFSIVYQYHYDKKKFIPVRMEKK